MRKHRPVESTSESVKRGNLTGVRRTTVVLPRALDFNISLYALTHGRPKGEIVRDALAQFIRAQGLDPDRVPTVGGITGPEPG